MPLTEAQELKRDKYIEQERRGIINADGQVRLDEMRKRGYAKPDPFTQTDTSPAFFDEQAERKRVTRPSRNRMVAAPLTVNTELLEERRARAKTGQLESNLEIFSNLKLGLAAYPNKEIKKVLDAQFKTDVPVRYDPLTKKYQYVDPGSNRITSIGIEGLDVSDLAEAAGEAPVVVGDVAGTVLGGTAGAATPIPGGAVAGETVGSAIGVYIGEMVKLSTGKAFGMNESLTIGDMHKLALKKAGITGGITAVAGITMHTGKAIVNFVQGRTGSKEAAIRAGLKEDQAERTLNAVNDMQRKFGPLPEERVVKTTTAKRSGDEILLGDETTMRREKDYVSRFVERDAADEKGLASAFDAITPEGAGGDSASTHFKHVRNQRLDKATKSLNQSKQNLEEQLQILTPTNVSDTGTVVRKAIEDKRIAVNNQIKRVQNQWKKLAGVNADQTASSVKIPLGKPARKMMSTLDKESRNAVAIEVRNARKGVLTEKFRESKGGQAIDTGIVDLRGNPITRIQQAQNTDLVDYQRTISAFRKIIRDADKGQSTLSGEQVVVVARTLKALLRNRDAYLSTSGKDDVLFAIKNADTFTAESKTMLDRSVAGDIMQLRNGRYTVRNQDIFDKGFVKGGREQSKEMVRVIGGNEEAMRTWRGEILEKYKAEVVGEEGPTLKRHIKFVKDYEGSMEPYFTKTEMNQIRRLGGLIRVVQAKEKAHRNILRTINSPEGKVGKMRKLLPSLDPEQVAPWVIGDAKTGPGRVRRLISTTKSMPRAIVEVREEVRNLFRRDVLANGVLDHARFSSHIKRNEATYRELFGDKYVDDLFVINDAMDIADRAGRTLAERSLEGIEVQVARGSMFAPLTKEGRLFTAYLKFRTRMGRQAIANALLNPTDLSELAALSELSKTSREAVEMMASLGYMAATSQELEQ